MTGTTRSTETLDSRQRKLLFRAWHRGMREMDLVLGTFADAEIDKLSDEELDAFEILLHENDADFLKWVTGERPVPDHLETPLMRRILDYRPVFLTE
ncbi:succinate dehydrogenase assembly factor 2 [Oryzicola mucosus]|uniref:FAD assembly factor SdhE n=1 Tax=Oryzicola mucosus TaxID=2767425 RepID=A0A8J6PYB4_9HYPH|nr:succinate dehydrogenase assembly factor 2 [Oryzicola mucosus]MBD0416432.1 succinate dehydrogenase assembly factor 2 [Oryzicola mucosus]